MINLSTEVLEARKIQLLLLQELLKVCNEHNLKIFAAYGTLLGAIRHKGFIPWDDDIDMDMLRPDYDKLVSIAPKAFQPPFFFKRPIRIKIISKAMHNSDTMEQLLYALMI